MWTKNWTFLEPQQLQKKLHWGIKGKKYQEIAAILKPEFSNRESPSSWYQKVHLQGIHDGLIDLFRWQWDFDLENLSLNSER